ncbi:hypothetical protein Dda_1575 [Drechslerella dactyloides]|uniref:Apple domain-containing protein n=1 Tax=Drechslerella dactyloides TaxID=74499 RepID=A0AAD6NLX5_DREDA|nr:hypothetical protein Dda_1575 [Drechslerella dactyloides]
MHFTAYVAVAAAALVSVTESVALPNYELPGFSLKYSNLRSLPTNGKTIEPPKGAVTNAVPACASVCNSLPACQFFAIYTPLNSDKRECNFYEQADPYGGISATAYTSMVKEACGFAKQQRRAVKVRDVSAVAQPAKVPQPFQPVIYKRDNQTFPALNGTNTTVTLFERKFTYPEVIYHANQAKETPVKRCGTMCHIYLRVRCLWK